MKRIVIELTENESETLADSIGAYIEQTHLALGRCLGETAKELETINALRLRILAGLKFGKKQRVIEWHYECTKIPDEISEDHPILVRWKDPMLKEFVYDITTKYDIYGCQEWAVLPELPSED